MGRRLTADILAGAIATGLVAGPASAQPQVVTRAAAIDAALARGPRVALAAADTSVARGLVLSARAYPNPALGVSYTEDSPQYHIGFDVPVDYPWLRSTRIRATEALRVGTAHRFQLERAAAALDADTLYTHALAGRARADISRQNALAADSLYQNVVARRDAGDASTLDVEVASLFAGEQANLAAGDSLEFVSTVLALQAVMGVAIDSVQITLPDSLTNPASAGTQAPTATTLSVAAAESNLEAANLFARLERRNTWAPPSLTLGYDTHDPGGNENKLLPAIGLTLPLPLLNLNRGPIALADAERDRARAELAFAQAQSRADIARVLRERDIALARVSRDQQLLGSANRVATMSLTAYREGAAPLATVLEAQRSARDAMATYVDDTARAWIAIATARVVTLTAHRTGNR